MNFLVVLEVLLVKVAQTAATSVIRCTYRLLVRGETEGSLRVLFAAKSIRLHVLERPGHGDRGQVEEQPNILLGGLGSFSSEAGQAESHSSW